MDELKMELERLVAAFETQNSALWGVCILEFIDRAQHELDFARSGVDMVEQAH